MDCSGKNTGIDFHFLLQGIFFTQGSIPHLHQQGADSLPLSHQGSLIGICYLGDWSGKLTFFLFLGITNNSMIFINIATVVARILLHNLIAQYGRVCSVSKNILTISVFCLFKKVYGLYPLLNCWKRWNRYNSKFHIEFFNILHKIVHFSSVALCVSNSLRPHESQHARPPCPSLAPRVHSDSRPSSQWCHPAISSSVVPFSFCPQSLPASESFPMSHLFTWGGQSTGVSALASFLAKKSQGLSPLGWTGWISLQSKGLSRVFSNTTVQKHQFFGAQLSSHSNARIHTWPLEKP